MVVSVIAASDHQLVGAYTHAGSSALGIDAGLLAGCGELGVPVSSVDDLGDFEVVVDVSLPSGTAAVLAQLAGRPFVSGVTGLPPATLDALDAAAEEGPVLLASNFSAGVHVLADAVARASAALPDYDLEIVEAHHRHKLDAPSGTAVMLAAEAARARGWDLAERAVYGREGRTGPRGQEIALHALRCGDVVGEHTVWLAGEGERLLLGHVATRRETFAHGAVRAAAWMAGRAAGRYSMVDVLGL
jgi:4-hydroxy-tetrahydrodipicolinate reductase